MAFDILAKEIEMLNKMQILGLIAGITLSLCVLGLAGCTINQSPSQVPVSDVSEAPRYSLVAIDNISLSRAPVLNETIPLTYTISPKIDIPDTTIIISFRKGNKECDNITSQVNLVAGHPVTLSTNIVFKETGKWNINVRAYKKINDKDCCGAGVNPLFLTIGVDNSTFGWQRSRIDPVPDYKNMPPAPTLRLDGTWR
ncbi:MAG: hypothetical protein PHO26_07770 [Dehalococcoidia bacterium]|nr:hypothetical protein [Dehalococcoidia bacterium]